jgi:hypothetical protein
MDTVGTEEGTLNPGPFNPSQSASRARMAEWLYKASNRGCDDPQNPTPNQCYSPPTSATFRDVPTSYRYFEAIEWARAAGITNGYDDGTFRPDGLITRQAMAAMFHRYVD